MEYASRDDNTKTLSGVELFADLSVHERRDLESQCIWQSFDKNQQIIHHQEISSEIYFVTAGIVRANVYALTGKMVAFRDVGEGEFFGELSAIDQHPRSATIEAMTSGTIARMSSHVLWDQMKSNPKIMEKMLRYVTSQIRVLTERVYEYSTLTVNNRIHSELLRLCRQMNSPNNQVLIDPSPTHFEIANRISTHREAVTRELNRLAEIGLIERSGGRICIKDVSSLAKLVRETSG